MKCTGQQTVAALALWTNTVKQKNACRNRFTYRSNIGAASFCCVCRVTLLISMHYCLDGGVHFKIMRINTRLSIKIAELIKHQHLKQNDVTSIIGLPQLKLSNLLRDQFRDISEAKMLYYLPAACN